MVDYKKILTDWLTNTDCTDAMSEMIGRLNAQGLEFKNGKIQEMPLNPNENLIGQKRIVRGTEALCILQTPIFRIWAALEGSKEKMTYKDAEKWAISQFSKGGHLPNRAEMMWLWRYFESIIDVTDEEDWYWTGDEFTDDQVWAICWYDGNTTWCPKECPHNVLAFYNETLI